MKFSFPTFYVIIVLILANKLLIEFFWSCEKEGAQRLRRMPMGLGWKSERAVKWDSMDPCGRG